MRLFIRQDVTESILLQRQRDDGCGRSRRAVSSVHLKQAL
jgi:hypothetical protein